MSVLEWVLYPTIGVLVLVYIIKTIYDIKHPEKRKKKRKNEDEEEEQE